MSTEPAHTVKHICNSHKPTLKPKIAKELVCFPALFFLPKKQNLVSAKTGNKRVLLNVKTKPSR
jgi:hypothetical protein